MNTLLKKVPLVLLAAIALIGQMNAGTAPARKKRGAQSAQTAAGSRAQLTSDVAMVSNNASLIERIFGLASEIAMARGEAINTTRSDNRAKLNDLMKQLDPKLKKSIEKDIRVILTAKGAKGIDEMMTANERLEDVKDAVMAQANRIDAYASAAKRVQDAPVEMKQQVVADATSEIQAAEEQAEETYLEKAKMFASQYLTAKNAFYAAAGAAFAYASIVTGKAAIPAAYEEYGKAAPEGETYWGMAQRISGATVAPTKKALLEESYAAKLGKWSYGGLRTGIQAGKSLMSYGLSADAKKTMTEARNEGVSRGTAYSLAVAQDDLKNSGEALKGLREAKEQNPEAIAAANKAFTAAQTRLTMTQKEAEKEKAEAVKGK